MGRKATFGKERKSNPNSFKARFGAFIRDWRSRNGLTQMDVARLVYQDETKTTRVSDVERGRNEPTPDTVNLYCAALKIDPDDIARLRRGSTLNWPFVIAPGIGLERSIVGRNNDVLSLHEKISAASSGAIVTGIVVKGQGGMGKTALAKLYVERYRHLYHGVWWVGGQTKNSIIDELCDLAEVLGIPETGAGRHAMARATIVKLQQETEPWLIVYDNVESHGHLREFRPEGGNIKLAITSREGSWPPTYSVLEIEKLATDMAVELLLQESKRRDDEDGAYHLAGVLDGLPLALVAAGAWLQDTATATFGYYEERLNEMLMYLPESIEDYPENVFATTMLSVEKLSVDARLLLEVASFLYPDDIWPELLSSVIKYDLHSDDETYLDARKLLPQEICQFSLDKVRIERAIAELVRRSLVEKQSGAGFRVHRLTQAVIRASLGARYVDIQNAAVAILAAAYPSHEENPEYFENWPVCSRLERHVETVVNTALDSAALEIVLKQASRYLDAQGDYGRALEYRQRLLSSMERRLPKGHVEIGGARNDLAIGLWRLCRFDEAEEFAGRAAEQALVDEEVPIERRAKWLSIHGVILNHQGVAEDKVESKQDKFEKSRRRYLYALYLDLKKVGRNRRVIGLRLYNLGVIRGLQGRYEAAIRLHAAGLRIKRATIPEGNPDIAFGLLGLGTALLEAGKVRERSKGESAIELIEESLSIRERAFHEKQDHPDRIKSASWAAVCHRVLIQLQDRAGSYKRAKEIEEKYKLDVNYIKKQADKYFQIAVPGS